MKHWFFLLGLFLALIPLSWAADPLMLVEIRGEVQVLKKGAARWISAEEKMPLEMGDKVKTGKKSRVNIEMGMGTVTLYGKTEFAVKEYSLNELQLNTSLQLTLGKLKAKVNKDRMKEDPRFEITTPTSVAAVRGTTFSLQVYESQGEILTRLDVLEGVVHFSDEEEKQSVEVSAGNHTFADEEEVMPPLPGVEEIEETLSDEEKMTETAYEEVSQNDKGTEEEIAREVPEPQDTRSLGNQEADAEASPNENFHSVNQDDKNGENI